MQRADILQFIVTGLTMGSVYALVGLGFTIIHNSSDVVNFLQGEFVMIGAMTAVTLAERGAPYPAALAGGVLASFLFGMGFERAIISPLRRHTVLNVIIITIGASILTRGIAMLMWGKDHYPLDPIVDAAPLEVAGAVILPQHLVILAVASLLVALFWVFYRYTVYGKAMRACAENRTAALICGIEPRTMVMYSFGISALLGGIGGVLIAPVTLASYDMGLAVGLKGFAAGILGGIANPLGAVLGGAIIGLVESLGAGLLSSHFKDAFAFLLLLLTLFVMPNGILGRRNRA